MDTIVALIPVIISALSLIGSIIAIKSQRKMSDANAADKLSMAAARNAEVDSKRIDGLVARVTFLDNSMNEKDAKIEELGNKVAELTKALDAERALSSIKLARQQAQIDLLTKQVIALGGRPITEKDVPNGFAPA